MSFALLRRANAGISSSLSGITMCSYSRRSDSKLGDAYKVVKSKVRMDDKEEEFSECGPNWELFNPRGNRFYFPHAIGPAWQGLSTTLNLEAPLETLIDFDGKELATAMSPQQMQMRLQFSCAVCPSLIKDSLHELFPAPEVVSSDQLALMTLSFSGDNEQGARKFVLAAREITARLRLHGYWADFMNPFSGKPFHSWASGKNLYNVDQRFRGINMKLSIRNNCTIISTEDDIDCNFSGAIYTNAPANYEQLKTLIDEQL